MDIDIKLLDGCPELSDYEKDLIRRIDVRHETQASVTKSYNKTPSTISIQHKKALRKFEKWLAKQQTGATKKAEDFDAVIFKMLNRGDDPCQIIAKVGHAHKVNELSELWRQLKDDDYWATMGLLRQNEISSGRFSLESSLYSRVKHLIGSVNAERSGRLNAEEKVQTLTQELSVRDESVKLLRSSNDAYEKEITRLSRLRKYEDLTDEEIQKRRETRQDLDNAIKDGKSELNSINLKIDEAKHIVFDLHFKAREMVKQYLAEMSPDDRMDLFIEAICDDKDPLIAKLYKSIILGK